MSKTNTSKEIYIIRHGQTDYNLQGRVQGRGIDAPLNTTGLTQAHQFYQRYKGEGFKKVYTSALVRTHQSVRGFLEDGLEHMSFSGLDEIDWGNKEGRSFSKEDHNEYLQMTRSWKAGDLDHRIEGGESPNDVLRRQTEAWENIILESELHKVLVCMHGRAMRILLAHLISYDLRYMDFFHHDNLGLYKLIFTGKMYRIALFNDCRHIQ